MICNVGCLHLGHFASFGKMLGAAAQLSVASVDRRFFLDGLLHGRVLNATSAGGS